MELSLVEQFALIAQSADGEYRLALMWVCLGALGAGVVVGALYAVRRAVSKVCRMILWLGPVGCMLAGPLVFKMVLYGGSKPTPHLWRFQFENGVHDDGSFCTNDLITAKWTYGVAYASYAFRWAYRDLTVTNEVGVCIDPYHQLPDAKVSDMTAVAVVPDATNMEVVCYAQYVQPVHVVTNGVYHVGGIMRTLATTNSLSPAFVTPGVRIYARLDDGGELVLTPTNEPPEAVGGALLNMNNDNPETEE